MSVENSNYTAPIHMDDAAEDEEAQRFPAVEEQKADTPTIQEESPANKRIQDFATRANLTGKEGIDRKKLVVLPVGLVAAVLFFLLTQFQSKLVKPQAVEQKKQQDDNTASSQQQKSKTPIMDPVTPKEEQEAGRLSASDIARTKKPDYAPSPNENPTHTPNAGSGKSIGDVPSFHDTLQLPQLCWVDETFQFPKSHRAEGHFWFPKSRRVEGTFRLPEFHRAEGAVGLHKERDEPTANSPSPQLVPRITSGLSVTLPALRIAAGETIAGALRTARKSLNGALRTVI